MIDRLCIVGVGLIGGSLARCAKRSGLCREIVGADADPANLQAALAAGVIDRGYADAAEAAEQADLVMIAVPVLATESVLAQLKPVWNSRAVYSDAGSTKLNVVEAARRVFGEIPANFVPGHPIAGSERSGVAAADAELFRHKRVILTPLPETGRDALTAVADLWRVAGAEVAEMSPGQHDKILAATSHLPHIAAFALVDMLGREDGQSEAIFRYAAGGFRDFTRIAGSDATMWRDICLANRDAILQRIEGLREELALVAGLIEHRDDAALLELFQRAKTARQRFLTLFENHHAP